MKVEKSLQTCDNKNSSYKYVATWKLLDESGKLIRFDFFYTNESCIEKAFKGRRL